jgi:hypothetical protein
MAGCVQEAQKRILDDIRGIFFIAYEAIGDPPGPGLMARYNLFKGLQITLAGGLYQQFITVC